MTRDDHLRIPPHSIEAEQAVLGGLMLTERAWWDVCDVLTPEDFYRKDHQLIFRAIAEMVKRQRPFDAITLGDWFRSQKLDELVGGTTYVIELANSTPSAANIRAYADIVADKAMRRRMIDAGTDMVAKAFDESGPATIDLVGESQTRLSDLLSTQPCELVPLAPVMEGVYARLTARYGADSEIHGLSTGIGEIDDLIGGLGPGQLILVASRPKMGKEQPNSSLVRVPGGWKRIGELRIGDEVCSHDGAPSKVLGVFPQGVRDVYRIVFADGRVARCGIEHLWEVRHRKWPQPKVIDSRQLMMMNQRSPGRYSVRMVTGEFEQAAALPIDPWLVGFLIGDGGLTSCVSFSTMDEEILLRVRDTVGEQYSIRRYGECDYRIVTPCGQPNPLKNHLRELGLYPKKSPDKRIPPQYLLAGREQRMELLRGLVDSDGWVEKYGCVQIATSSPGLAQDIRMLVWSLGGKCSHRIKKSKGLPAHVLALNLGPNQVPVWLPRKVHRLKGGRGSQQWLTIKSIAPEGAREECTCIEVSHPSELYVTDNYVVTHNTTWAMNIAEHVAVSLKKVVAIFSFEMQPGELGDRLMSSVGSIAASKVRSGALDEVDWASATETIKRLRSAQILISRPKRARVEHVIAQIRRQHARTPLALVVIDYLQLMDAPGDNRAQAIGDITRALKLAASDLGIPIILLSQLNRDLERRPDKRPVPADLRDSGAIEQDADVVIFIYRDEVYHPDSKDRGTAELIVALQRNGPPGMVRAQYHPERFKFSNLPEHWQPLPSSKKEAEHETGFRAPKKKPVADYREVDR